jgi:hypothetical protein
MEFYKKTLLVLMLSFTTVAWGMDSKNNGLALSKARIENLSKRTWACTNTPAKFSPFDLAVQVEQLQLQIEVLIKSKPKDLTPEIKKLTQQVTMLTTDKQANIKEVRKLQTELNNVKQKNKKLKAALLGAKKIVTNSPERRLRYFAFASILHGGSLFIPSNENTPIINDIVKLICTTLGTESFKQACLKNRNLKYTQAMIDLIAPIEDENEDVDG